jgi:hypothetical protein
MDNKERMQKAKTTVEAWELGQTSKHFETSGRGVSTISTGKGDHGGVSYGAYQLSTNERTIHEYLRFAKEYQDDFKGLTPATPAFNQKWLELANGDSHFAKSQHDFIAQRHFEPQMKALREQGFDLSDRGKAVHDMLWSTAVQTRNMTPSIVINGIREEFGQSVKVSQLNDRQIIEVVQDYKLAHTEQLFRSSPNLWNGLRSRASNEKRELLELLDYENFYQQLNIEKKQVEPTSNESQPNPFANPDNFGALETPSLSPVAQTLVQQSEQKVREACERYNQPWTEGMCNTSMALAVVAREAQMSGVDALGVSQGTIYIAQTDRKGIYREAEINSLEAANIPMAQSEQRLAIVDQQMLAQEQQQAIDNLAQTQHKVHSGPRMG